ncbi:DUF3139 domain-containing protein [Rossellomorea sp. GCM10028870]|uniref:DUF3139 domain-containing protein n=1 Tax=Rossellomorea sp. GCM10028870 TaxID=3273426 RepID=UPI0036238C48
MVNFIKNRISTIITITLVSIFLTYLSYVVYTDIGEKKRYEAIFRYLTVEKGYKESDISKIEAVHSIQAFLFSYEPWSIPVVFNDEPNAIYYYHYNDGVISQGGISGYTESEVYKHFESVKGGLDKSKLID